MDNLEMILGIEFLLAAEAISLTEDQLGAFKLGKGTQAAFDTIRTKVPAAYFDTYMPSQSSPVIGLVRDLSILDNVEKAVGALL